MVHTEIDNHLEVSDRFLQDARFEFERGDLPQASEKAWGAVVHYLKAEANLRGWPNESDRDLIAIASDLSLETDDPKRADELFLALSGMRVNLYEERYLPGHVAMGINAAAELISRLENRRGPEIRDPRPSQAPRRPIRPNRPIR